MQQYHLLALTGLLFASTAIAQTSTVSVQGGVNRPGAYFVDPVGETLSTAIRKAGGVIPGASRAVIYRSDDHGVPHEIPVMLQPILDHRATDMTVKPGDVVYVPANGTKSPTQPVIDDRVFPAQK
jgi:protein involved in polysaccharide export with SLBB domain